MNMTYVLFVFSKCFKTSCVGITLHGKTAESLCGFI